jgi:hypothetical protein
MSGYSAQAHNNNVVVTPPPLCIKIITQTENNALRKLEHSAPSRCKKACYATTAALQIIIANLQPSCSARTICDRVISVPTNPTTAGTIGQEVSAILGDEHHDARPRPKCP